MMLTELFVAQIGSDSPLFVWKEFTLRVCQQNIHGGKTITLYQFLGP